MLPLHYTPMRRQGESNSTTPFLTDGLASHSDTITAYLHLWDRQASNLLCVVLQTRFLQRIYPVADGVRLELTRRVERPTVFKTVPLRPTVV